jgi:hypothetical protein
MEIPRRLSANRFLTLKVGEGKRLRRPSGQHTHYVQQPIFVVRKSRKIFDCVQFPQNAALDCAAARFLSLRQNDPGVTK